MCAARAQRLHLLCPLCSFQNKSWIINVFFWVFVRERERENERRNAQIDDDHVQIILVLKRDFIDIDYFIVKIDAKREFYFRISNSVYKIRIYYLYTHSVWVYALDLKLRPFHEHANKSLFLWDEQRRKRQGFMVPKRRLHLCQPVARRAYSLWICTYNSISFTELCAVNHNGRP